MTPAARLRSLGEQTAHEHKWQANGLVKSQHVMYSPVSSLDDTYQDVTHSVQVCECGEVRKVRVSVSRPKWLNR